MNEAQAVYTVIIGVGALIGVMAPVIKLNNSITKLTTTIEFMNQENKRQDDRLNAHSKTLDDHEKRISHLEK
ncbi:MAG: hypothetical protein ACLUVC_02065 [Longibaculum sp.]